MGLREAKRGKNGGQEAPKESFGGLKRATGEIEKDPNGLIPSASHIPPRARMGRIM